MKPWYCLRLLVPFIVTLSANARVYTLERLIDEAVKNSLYIQSALKAVSVEEFRIQEAYSSLFPHISVVGDLGHAFSQSAPYLVLHPEALSGHRYGLSRQEATAPPNESALPGLPNYLSRSLQFDDEPPEPDDPIGLPRTYGLAALTLKQPLFRQGKTFIHLRMARAAQLMLLCRYEEEKHRTRTVITKLFYRALAAQQTLSLRKDRLTLAEEAHRLTKVRFAADRARELDTLNSLLRLEQARLDLFEAEATRRTTAEELIVMANIAESPANLWVDGELPEPVFYITIEEALNHLYRDNFQIRQFRANETLHNEQIKLAKSDYLPQLNLGGSFGTLAHFSPGEFAWRDDHRVFLGLSWTIFSGLSRQHRVRRQIVERDLVLFAQQKTLDDLELKVRNAFEEVLARMERLTSLQTIVRIAETSSRITASLLDAGNATPFDLRSAEIELDRAKLAYTEALCTFHSAVAGFQFLVGM
jgi:outer membrane protein TolC